MKESNKVKDITRDMETSKMVTDGKLSQIVQAASSSAQLEKERIIMEEKQAKTRSNK
jgi:hypothetical protein